MKVEKIPNISEFFPRNFEKKQKSLRLSQLIWLIVDAKNWQAEKPLLEWSLREPGSLSAGIRGLEFALYQNINQRNLTLELLEGIHDLSTGSVVNSPHLLGNFKTVQVVGLCEEKFKQNLWITRDELNHIYSNWFEFKPGVRNDQHAFNIIESKSLKLHNHAHISRLCHELNIVIINENDCAELQRSSASAFDFHQKVELHYQKQLVLQYQREEYKDYFQQVMPDIVGDGDIMLCSSKDKAVTQAHLEAIFLEYNQTINSRHTLDERLELILQTVQKIELLHPFEDGNLRTCIILMQRLLLQNKLSFSAFMDPFEFDFCSISELKQSYYSGVDYFNGLISSNPNRFNALVAGVRTANLAKTQNFSDLIKAYFENPQFAEPHMQARLNEDPNCKSDEWINLVMFDMINAEYLQGSVGTLANPYGPYDPCYFFPLEVRCHSGQYVPLYDETEQGILKTLDDSRLASLSGDAVSTLLSMYKLKKSFLICLLLSLGRAEVIVNNSAISEILNKSFATNTYASFLQYQFLSRIAPRPMIEAKNHLHFLTGGTQLGEEKTVGSKSKPETTGPCF